MLKRSQSPIRETVHLRAIDYGGVSRCVCAVLLVAATRLISGCSNNQRFGFGLGDRIAIVDNSLLNGCNMMDGLSLIFRPSILITNWCFFGVSAIPEFRYTVEKKTTLAFSA